MLQAIFLAFKITNFTNYVIMSLLKYICQIVVFVGVLNFHPNFELISKVSLDGARVDIIGVDKEGREMFSFTLANAR